MNKGQHGCERYLDFFFRRRFGSTLNTTLNSPQLRPKKTKRVTFCFIRRIQNPTRDFSMKHGKITIHHRGQETHKRVRHVDSECSRDSGKITGAAAQ
jgi:hypothetical protein